MISNLVDDPLIPRIGQQLIVEGYTLAITGRCRCQTGGTLVPLTITVSTCGTVTVPTVCPNCKFGYGIEGMQMDAQGRLSFGVAILSHTPAAMSS